MTRLLTFVRSVALCALLPGAVLAQAPTRDGWFLELGGGYGQVLAVLWRTDLGVEFDGAEASYRDRGDLALRQARGPRG